MNRRAFLQQASAGAVVISLSELPAWARQERMGIVVHSYAHRWNAKTPSTRYPALTSALDLLDHCQQVGGGGIQVVVNNWADDFAHSVRDRREKLGLYLEGSVGTPKTPADAAAFERNVIAAKEAGARILRTVCSSGRRYEILRSPEGFEEMRKNALASLQLAEPILRKHGVKLAVENHKDWRAPELAAMMKSLSSEWIGVTIDFGNNLALLEDSTEVVQTLAPYVLSTHVKDMALEPYADGFLLSEVPLGKGILDLPTLFALCRKHNPAVTFNLEMITRDPLEIPCLKPEYWATFAQVPGSDLARTLRQVNGSKTAGALPRISPLAPEERLAAEQENIVACMQYSQKTLGLR
ncbi:sugar phosphate isomerase/epimerase family protein [Rudanella lutea]|uniref:sugar phosphate isomerase/epimerase family protein n=1 Tax=Rudanella lutea TaxID=451374 RepID=UPI0003780F86|nr:TIM barrel protein [Rudanella lutea]